MNVKKYPNWVSLYVVGLLGSGPPRSPPFANDVKIKNKKIIILEKYLFTDTKNRQSIAQKP